jgi:hypothetical protein
MLQSLYRHRFVRGCTVFLAALLVYLSAVSLAYVLIGEVAKLAASGA